MDIRITKNTDGHPTALIRFNAHTEDEKIITLTADGETLKGSKDFREYYKDPTAEDLLYSLGNVLNLM